MPSWDFSTWLRHSDHSLTASTTIIESCKSSEIKYGPLVTGSDTYPIRLLKLFPAANFATEIKYELLHARLEDQPEFEALSYEWGEDKHNPSTPIFVHGNTYYVTKNLQSALRYLQLKHEPRIIWADAICINQYDTEERAQQVSQMRKIYDVDGARRVLVWLGEEGSAKLDLDFSDKISIRNATGKDSEN